MARPRKPILLVSQDEDALGIMRFIFRCYPQSYRAASAYSAQEALDALQIKQYHVMICLFPVQGLELILERARSIDRHMRTIVVVNRAAFIPAADAVLVKPSTAELLERVNVFAVRKRGPHQVRKPVARETFELKAEVPA